MSEHVPSASAKLRPQTGSYEHTRGVAPSATERFEDGYEPRPSGARSVAERVAQENPLDHKADEKFALVRSRIANTFHPTSEEERVSILDLSVAVSDLWHYLHENRVSLAKKAELISALEPLRRKLRSEPSYVSFIEKARARENALRPVYIAARGLLEARQMHKQFGVWDRGQIVETKAVNEMTQTVREYLHTPLASDPSLNERHMDEEIRSIATKLGMMSERYAGNFAFEQGHAAYYALRDAVDRRAGNPSETLKKAVIDAQDTFREALFQEMQEFETTDMEKERAGLMKLREALRFDSIEGLPKVITATKDFIAREPNFVQEVYRDILNADTAEDGESAWANIMPRFHQLHLAEQTRILRLARYYREVIYPREQLLIQRHVAQHEIESTTDEMQKATSVDRMANLEEELHREIVLTAESEPDIGEFTHEVDHLFQTWERRAEHPHDPHTIDELKAPWEILTSQYNRTLTLFEQLGHLSVALDADSALNLKQKLKSVIEHMRGLERHYAHHLCRDILVQEKVLDTNLWYLENMPSYKGKETDSPENIAHKTDQLKGALEQIADTYPPLKRSEPWKTAWVNYETLKQRIGDLGFGNSTVPTVRPPRPSDPDTI